MMNADLQFDRMKKCFPSWTDIRKRANKSNGGSLLYSYAKESDEIQKELDRYQQEFFLWYYDKNGLHETIPAYLYVSLIGDRPIENISIEEYVITNNVTEFYSNRETHILYQDSCLIMHKELVDKFKEDRTVEYNVKDGDEVYTYKAKMYYRHVWNIFDEFAKFSGLTRYEGESNRELSTRVWQQYINFPNASEIGLKNAIINGIYNFFSAEEVIKYKDIKIEIPTVENMALPDKDYNDIYDHITKYNKDQFRVKRWDTSLWEHPFKKSELIAHPWDKEPAKYQDGVGFGEDLKVEYVNNIDEEESTDLEVYGYVRDRKTLIKYLHDNNIETAINLKLLKYKDTLNPVKLQYKINASKAIKINPNDFNIVSKQKKTGNKLYKIEDIIKSSEDITVIPHNILSPGKKYKFILTPKSDFSSMATHCFSVDKTGAINENSNLLIENSEFGFRNEVFENKQIFAHATSVSDFNDFSNMEDSFNGMTVSSAAQEGLLTYDVTGMSGKTVFVQSICPEVNILENAAMVTASGDFERDSLAQSITAEEGIFTGESTIVLNIDKCRSFSFDFKQDDTPGKAGDIKVSIMTATERHENVYHKSEHISQSFPTPQSVQVIIKRNSFHYCRIENVRAARYEIVPSISHGTVKVDQYTGKMKISGFSSETEKTFLTLSIQCYSSSSPSIEYVHFGDSVKYSKYVVDYDASDVSCTYTVRLRTECNATLYEINNDGSTTLIDKNYDTSSSYKNTTDKKGYIFLDLTDFKEIKSSSLPIKHKYNGQDINYIEIEPEIEIKDISINGIYLKTLQKKRLAQFLFDEEGYEENDVFVTRIINSFIINDKDNNTYLKDITYDMLPFDTDVCYVEQNNKNVVTAFVINEVDDVLFIGSEIDKKFSKLCIYPNDNKEYVAYNTTMMYSNVKKNIPLLNTFSPILSFYDMFVYVLDEIKSSTERKSSVSFVHQDGKEYKWSLGAGNYIKATSDFNFDNFESYDLTIKNIYNKYIVSNDIPLDNRYIIGGEDYELMEFVVTPPDDIEIAYKTNKYREGVVISNTGFNKLKYSNTIITSIYLNGTTLLTEGIDYEYPKDEEDNKGSSGIIVWKKEEYFGQSAVVEYNIKCPVGMYFKDETALYKVVKFDINAYRQLEDENIFLGLVENDVVSPSFSCKPDKIITTVSNPKFETLIDQDLVKIVRLETDDKIAVHNGYIYEDGKEYYFFCDKHIEDIHSINNVELHNVVKFHDRLECNIASVNHIPWSNMETSITKELCRIDFTAKKFENISDFNHLTACESFSNWHNFNNTVSIVQGLNGYGTKFARQTTLIPQSYSIVDITPYVKKGKIISLYKDKSVTVSIAEESIMNELPFTKSICISEDNVKAFENMEYKGFSYHIIDYDPIRNARYYLMVEGNGMIDDITITSYTSIDDSYNTHKKNIDNINFLITEKNPSDRRILLPFTSTGLKLENAEYSGFNDTLAISTNVFYGLTLLDSIVPQKMRKYYCKEIQDVAIAENDDAYIETKGTYISMRESVSKLYVKINDINTSNFGPFNIVVYTSQTEDGDLRIIDSRDKTNIVEVEGAKLLNYVFVKIIMPKNVIMQSVEIYAQYSESSITNLPINYGQDGYAYTKIYDLGKNKNFKVSNIEYELAGNKENISFSFRGFKNDNANIVSTEWYDYSEDENQKENNAHIFNEYSLIQFRAFIKNSDTRLRIKEFALEEVDSK